MLAHHSCTPMRIAAAIVAHSGYLLCRCHPFNRPMDMHLERRKMMRDKATFEKPSLAQCLCACDDNHTERVGRQMVRGK